MTRTPRPSLPKRPARASVPPLPSFEALDATHREVLQTLERLQLWVEQLDPQRVDDATRATADEICRFFDGSARAHHAAEEAHVFPSLLASGDAVLVQHVRHLQQAGERLHARFGIGHVTLQVMRSPFTKSCAEAALPASDVAP